MFEMYFKLSLAGFALTRAEIAHRLTHSMATGYAHLDGAGREVDIDSQALPSEVAGPLRRCGASLHELGIHVVRHTRFVSLHGRVFKERLEVLVVACLDIPEASSGINISTGQNDGAARHLNMLRGTWTP